MSRRSTSSSDSLRDRCAAILAEEAMLREGGGKSGHERQRKMGRLPARERIGHLLDQDSPFFEVGLWAAYKMYSEWGNVPAAGCVAGIGNIVMRPMRKASGASMSLPISNNSRASRQSSARGKRDERETDYFAARSFFSRARNRASRSSLKMVLNSMFLLSQSFFVMTESVIAPL